MGLEGAGAVSIPTLHVHLTFRKMEPMGLERQRGPLTAVRMIFGAEAVWSVFGRVGTHLSHEKMSQQRSLA